jgi:DNA-binding MarR family transcriptional regulator
MSGRIPFAVTLRVRDSCFCFALQRAARALARHFDQALKEAGLTNGQFSLLMALNRAEAPSIGALASSLAMDRSTLTANVKPLARRGLLRVVKDADDRRAKRLLLTPAGHAALAAALPHWRRAHADIERRLAPPASKRLRKTLAALA